MFKTYVKWLTLVIIAGVLAAVLVSKYMLKREVHRLKDEAELQLSAASEVIRQVVSYPTEQLQTLLQLEQRILVLLAKHKTLERDHEQFAELFTQFIRRDANHRQLRWIDGSGMERFRVNQNDNGVIEVVNSKRLQNKQQRYYFHEMLMLSHGEIYISPVDLNIEQGRIDTPFQPMIRFASPMISYSDQQEPHGYLVLNYSMSESLTLFASQGKGKFTLQLLNSDGYWLQGHQHDDEWGFLLGKTETFAQRYPDRWRTLSSSYHGEVKSENNFTKWQTISSFHSLPEKIANPDQLKAVIEIAPQTLARLKQSVWQISWISALLFISVMGTLAFFLVAARYRERIAAEQVAYYERKSREELVERERLTQRLLVDTQNDYRLLVENLEDVYWIVTPDWQKVLYISPSYQQVWGRGCQSLLNRPLDWLDAVHPEDRQKLECYIEHASETHQHHYDFPIYRIILPNHSIRWIKARGYSVVDSKDQISKVAGIAADVTAYKEAEAAIERLRLHSSKMILASLEEDRKRLSQELHDHVGQLMAALKIGLKMIERKASNIDTLQENFNQMLDITDHISQSIREITHQLRPPQLEDLGLAAALRWHCHGLEKSAPLTVYFQENFGKQRLFKEIELNIFRIVQEATANVLHHAQAKELHLSLALKNDQLILNVVDDGCEFRPETLISINQGNDSVHMGLQNIKDRVSTLDGVFNLESAPQKGCRLTITIPLLKRASNHES